MAKKKEVAEEVEETSQATEPQAEQEAPKAEQRNSAAEEESLNKTISDMKAFLESQPKIEVYLPFDPGEKLGAFVPVTMNGYRLNVPKGVRVKVPSPVADILFESFNIYEHNSASAMRADREEVKDGESLQDALS